MKKGPLNLTHRICHALGDKSGGGNARVVMDSVKTKVVSVCQVEKCFCGKVLEKEVRKERSTKERRQDFLRNSGTHAKVVVPEKYE